MKVNQIINLVTFIYKEIHKKAWLKDIRNHGQS